MKRLGDFLFVRHRHNWLLLLRFGVVGGSGVLVNLAVAVLCNRFGPFHDAPIVSIPFTEFNIRWYHLYFLVSFLVANLWNFQLNRRWTFRSAAHARWISEYLPFLLVGLVTMAVGQLIITGLMNPTSPIALPRDIFDNSVGFRSPYYWAQLIAVVVTVPVSFVVNKVWTFRAVRGAEESFTVADTRDEIEVRLHDHLDADDAPTAADRPGNQQPDVQQPDLQQPDVGQAGVQQPGVEQKVQG